MVDKYLILVEMASGFMQVEYLTLNKFIGLLDTSRVPEIEYKI